jgi:uncharacterized protein (DUF427 family)
MSSPLRNPAPGFAENPGYRISVQPFGKLLSIRFGALKLASSGRALRFLETGYEPVIYVPFDDIRFEHLSKSETSTFCPYKGTASYWSVTGAGPAGKDILWAYQHPYDEMTGIKDYGAFYANRVELSTR